MNPIQTPVLMAHAFAMACLLSGGSPGQVPLDTQNRATYRQLFDRGVTALDEGEYARAAELFWAAGRRAPDAPLWRTYLDRANGEMETAPLGPAVTPAASVERLTWDPVEVTVRASSLMAQLSATGERLLRWNRQEAALVDAGTGSLVARLRSRIDTSRNDDPSDSACTWTFDTSGRVVLAVGGRDGGGMGLDVRDSATGRPIDVEGVATLNPTPGSRYQWFSLGEEAPECPFKETVDLHSAEGLLRCHLVPQADGKDRYGCKRATLSSNASHAMVRGHTSHGSTTLWIIDRLSEEVILERSPAGWQSWFSPDGASLYVRSREDVKQVDLRSGRDLWALPLPPRVKNASYQSALTFRGDELVEVAATGVVSQLDDATGARGVLQQLQPAPAGAIYDAKFVRGGRLLIVRDSGGTSCYEVENGKRIWNRGVPSYFADPATDVVDQAEQRCVIQAEQYEVAVVSIDTGEPIGVEGIRMTPIRSVALVEGKQAAVVALADGELRRVDLETGATTARAAAVRDGPPYFLQSVTSGRLWTFSAGGGVIIRDAETLEPMHGAVSSQRASLKAVSEDGMYAIMTRRDPAQTRLVKLTEDLRGEVVFQVEEHWSVAAFSPSGDTLALAGDGRLKRLDGRTGELRFEGELLPGFKLSVAAFHREEELIIGEAGHDKLDHDFDRPKAWVIEPSDGDIITELEILGPGLGCGIMHIHSNPDAGGVVLTTSGYLTVIGFEDVEWTRQWDQGLESGNYGTFIVRRARGSQLACVSGPPGGSRAFDVSTGAILRRDRSNGFLDLALTSGDRFLVGRKDQRLVVMDGESFETLYSREDAIGGYAWILGEGTRRPALGGALPVVDPSHLIQAGWSAPTSSFDPWIYDPLELGPTTFETLPRLPVILNVKDVEGAEGHQKLAITSRATTAIIGVLLEDAAGAESFVRIVEGDRRMEPTKPVLVDAPTITWTSVCLVASSGVLSRPFWRR